MPSPEITITLGRSRQIVKRKHSDLDGARTGSYQASLRARLGSGGGDNSSSFGNKRQRSSGSQRNGDGDGSDGHLGHSDLRLKLMRRRELESRTTRTNEQRTAARGEISVAARSSMNSNMSRRDLEPRESSHVTRAPPRESARSSLYIDSPRNMYLTRDDLRPRSPQRAQRTSRSVSPQPYRKELQNMSRLRSIDTSSAHHASRTDVLEPSRPTVPAHLMTSTASEAARTGTQIPPSNGGMQRSMYMGEVPLTVAGLLSSLGLGKYAINFQAEEVDMMALRQMGEKDLKDIGIPMGPRKKILQALVVLSRRQQQQPRQL